MDWGAGREPDATTAIPRISLAGKHFWCEFDGVPLQVPHTFDEEVVAWTADRKLSGSHRYRAYSLGGAHVLLEFRKFPGSLDHIVEVLDFERGVGLCLTQRPHSRRGSKRIDQLITRMSLDAPFTFNTMTGFPLHDAAPSGKFRSGQAMLELQHAGGTNLSIALEYDGEVDQAIFEGISYQSKAGRVTVLEGVDWPCGGMMYDRPDGTAILTITSNTESGSVDRVLHLERL